MQTLEELMHKYTSVEVIGEGGQKKVYKAIDPSGAVVALKVMRGDNDVRINREIEIMRGLSVDGVPRILDSGTVFDEDIRCEQLYVVEEFVDGDSLDNILRGGKLYGLAEAYELTNCLLVIELSLQNNRVIHRDIKPANIIKRSGGGYSLVDFGIARQDGLSTITDVNAAHGPLTPGYAPNEQVSNDRLSQDVRTDLYEIGVTVYECCTGSNPFTSGARLREEVYRRTAHMTPPPLSLAGDPTGSFGQFIAMLMGKNPSQRPKDARQALDYLAAITPFLEL